MASESESEKRETLADIVAESRTRSREVKEAFGGRPEGVENMLDIWADRIEATWKREMTEAEANALAVGGLVEAERQRVVISKKKTTTIGNAAALRSALEKVRFYLPYFLQYMRLHWEDAEAGGYYERILEVVNAALSAPARNCDLFGGDPKMLNTAWFDWTASPSGHDTNGAAKMTFAGWLLAPAAERKGDGDGR